MSDEVTSPVREAIERVLETPVTKPRETIGTVTECSICRREHGREIVHEAE